MMKFFNDDTGAIKIDWVALSGMLVLLGMLIVFAIFNAGGNSVLEIITSFNEDYHHTAANRGNIDNLLKGTSD